MRAFFLVLLFPMVAHAQVLELIRAPDTARLQRDEQIKQAPALPQETAILKFDPRRPKVRVVVDCGNILIGAIRCDIGLSESLVERPGANEQERVVVLRATPQQPQPVLYELLAKHLQDGEEAHLNFTSGIRDVTVGLIVKVMSRRRQLTVEVEPRFILPSGYEDTLSVRSLALAQSIIDAQKTQVNQLRNLSYGSSATSPYSEQQRDEFRRTANQIDPIARKDDSVLSRVRTYAAQVYEDGSVYIRVYAGNLTLDGTVK